MGCHRPNHATVNRSAPLFGLLLGAALVVGSGPRAQTPPQPGGELPRAARAETRREAAAAQQPLQAPPTQAQRGQAQRAKPRRSRQPTVRPVRADTRLPVVSPRVRRDTQVPVTGLPDTPVPTIGPPDPTNVLSSLRRRRLTEDDAYAPLGLRQGGFTYFPAIEQSIGYDSNPNRTTRALAKGSFVSRTDAEIRLQSGWSAHELTGFLRGGYSAFPKVPEADRPDGEGRIALRLDASRDTAFDVEGHYRFDTQRPGSPDLNAQVRERPIVATEGASAGVTQRFNRLLVSLRGGLDRLDYEDARLTDGRVLDQSDRNETRSTLRLRAGYELTPGVTPFVEGFIDRRDYERRVDDNGFRRSSDGIGAKAGSTFEITRLITGEISGGYEERAYDDRRLGNLRGPVADAAIIWQATPLTQLRLRGSKRLDETTVLNATGVVSDQAVVELQHDLRRNLSLIGALAFTRSDYQGVRLVEEGFAASAKIEYRLTRTIALRASYTHERLKSTAPGSDYTADVFLVGLRFQP